jgi:hypothetical protein
MSVIDKGNRDLEGDLDDIDQMRISMNQIGAKGLCTYQENLWRCVQDLCVYIDNEGYSDEEILRQVQVMCDVAGEFTATVTMMEENFMQEMHARRDLEFSSKDVWYVILRIMDRFKDIYLQHIWELGV